MIRCNCKNLVLLLFLFVCFKATAQRKNIPIQQPDNRFTIIAQRSWSPEGEEEYIFYVKNNTDDEYQLTAKATLDLACHGTTVIELGRTGSVYLKPRGLFKPGQDDNRHIFKGGNSESSLQCRIKDGNSYTFFKSVNFTFANIIKVTQPVVQQPQRLPEPKKDAAKDAAKTNTQETKKDASPVKKTETSPVPSAMEARAAFILAEEEFAANRYENSLKFIEQAAAKPGNASPQLLYLKIKCLQALNQKDIKYTADLKSSIEAFEKSQGLASFPEDKQLDVMKIKLRLSQGVALATGDFTESMTETFKKYQPNGFRLGMTLEEAKQLKPNFFAKASKAPVPNDNTAESYTLFESGGSVLNIITFKNGRVTFINGAITTSGENKSFSKGKAALDNFLQYFTGTPEVKTEEKSYTKNDTTIETVYTWKEGNVIATIRYSTVTYKFMLGTKTYSSSLGFAVQITP
jgi:hypothetical protein